MGMVHASSGVAPPVWPMWLGMSQIGDSMIIGWETQGATHGSSSAFHQQGMYNPQEGTQHVT